MRSIKALRHLLAASALVALAPGFAGAQMRGIGQPQLQPQGPARLIDVIDIDERESQVDITLKDPSRSTLEILCASPFVVYERRVLEAHDTRWHQHARHEQAGGPPPRPYDGSAA